MNLSNAGVFLLKAMLQHIGFDDAIQKISDPELRFSPLDIAYTQAWMTVNDVDAPYQINEMDLKELACFLNVPRSPLKDDIYDFYSALREDECEAFVDELARCYKRTGLIDGNVVFFDNHTIPYYGGVPIGFVYHATRNMPIKGIHLAQLNDHNGNFILFKITPSTTEFADILVELLERMRRVLDITTPLILVVDREAEGLPLFQNLSKRNIHFVVVITKNAKVTREMNDIPETEFVEEFREGEKIVETEISLKDVPFRAGVILNENGKRYGFRTTIPKDIVPDIKEVARLVPARWRQENKFEEIKNGEHGDKIARYEFVDSPNIHLQKKYKKLSEELQKIEKRKKRSEKELEKLRLQHKKKNDVFKKRLSEKDEELKNLEERLRNVRDRNVFSGRLNRKVKEITGTIQYYSTSLAKIKLRIETVTKKLMMGKKKREKIEKELKNIDTDADFFQLNTASTTLSIAVKEAVANVNTELTRRVSHKQRPMKVNRAKKALYKLPGKIMTASSTKIVEFTSIRNKPFRKRVENLCDWVNEKQIKDTDGKRLVFKVKNT